MGVAIPDREIQQMSDTTLVSKEPLNENATLADLKAKKERQRATPTMPSPAVVS